VVYQKDIIFTLGGRKYSLHYIIYNDTHQLCQF